MSTLADGKPDFLYKFCNLVSDDASADEIDWHLENLRAGEIYFSDPLNLNDPFDSNIVANYEFPDDVFMEMLKESRAVDNPEKISEDDFQRLKVAHIERIEKSSNNPLIRRRPGVSCFSARWNSVLMWGHYTNRYHGYCLEFDTQKEPFSRSKKILYSLDRPVIKLHEVLKNEELWEREFSKSLHTKHREWHYEKEWRLLTDKRCDTLFYDKSSLKSVIVGMRVTTNGLERIQDALTEFPGEVKIYRCEPEPGRFALKRVLITPS